MKKQIFVLMIALLAGYTLAWGQAVNNTDAKALGGSCVTGPLNPVAGVPYTYNATFDPSGGTFRWWVTTNPAFFATGTRSLAVEPVGGSYVLAAGANYDTNASPAAASESIDITWNSAGLSLVDYSASRGLFLVVDYIQDPGAENCPTNNMQVFKISPINAFTLDITNVNTLLASQGYGVDVAHCYSDDITADYDFGTDKVLMDYGINTLYFEVIAANFSGSFKPTFMVSGLLGDQTADIEWSYSPAGPYTSIQTDLGNGTATAAITASTTELTTAAGVSIYIKVLVNNNKFEGLAGQIITLAVDGVNASNEDDVSELDCTIAAAYSDVASQTIKQRPTIGTGTGTGFIIKN